MFPPSEPMFDLTENRDTLSEILAKVIRNSARSLEKCPESGYTMLLPTKPTAPTLTWV